MGAGASSTRQCMHFQTNKQMAKITGSKRFYNLMSLDDSACGMNSPLKKKRRVIVGNRSPVCALTQKSKLSGCGILYCLLLIFAIFSGYTRSLGIRNAFLWGLVIKQAMANNPDESEVETQLFTNLLQLIEPRHRQTIILSLDSFGNFYHEARKYRATKLPIIKKTLIQSGLNRYFPEIIIDLICEYTPVTFFISNLFYPLHNWGISELKEYLLLMDIPYYIAKYIELEPISGQCHMVSNIIGNEYRSVLLNLQEQQAEKKSILEKHMSAICEDISKLETQLLKSRNPKIKIALNDFETQKAAMMKIKITQVSNKAIDDFELYLTFLAKQFNS